MNWCKMVMLLKYIITIFHKENKYLNIILVNVYMYCILSAAGVPSLERGVHWLCGTNCIPPIKDRM